MMIDFRLKTAGQKVGGLNVGLCPGQYEGKRSHQQTLYLTENTFSFVESTIRNYSPKYAKPYSHWGITEISRKEWENIIQGWSQLKRNIAMAKNAQDMGINSKDLEKEFSDDFEKNKAALLNMIEELSNWLLLMLKAHEEISILGI